MRIFLISAFCILCFLPRSAEANEMPAAQIAELTRAVQELRGTVEKQQKEIAELRAIVIPAPAGGALPATPRPATSAAMGRWNPDIGVVADTVLKLDSPKSDAEGADRLSIRELELVFGSPVDPYSRLDATLAIADFEAMSIEEAYLTRYELPLGLTGRLGRLFPKIGKANPIHRDSLETVDEPLVIQRWFGLDGLHKTGLDMSRPIELPTPWVHEGTFGVVEGGNGEDGTVFGTSRRRPTLYAHLKNYFDLGETSGLELGANWISGSSDVDGTFEVNICGFDATWIYQADAVRSLKLQSEGYFMNRDETLVVSGDDATGALVRTVFDSTLWGAYALCDLRFHPQWSLGARVDYVEPVNNPLANPDDEEKGFTGYLTFYQSEFARWRVQFNHIDLATGGEDNQVLLQGTFAIGEHKHKLQ